MSSDPWFLGALLAIGVLSGGTAAVVGFGIGSLLTPLLLMRLNPTLAIAVVSIPHLVATAVRMLQHRRATDRDVLLRFGIPSAAGGLAGAWLQSATAETWLFVILGGLPIAAAVANLTRGFGGWKPPTAGAAALGFVTGLFGGLVGNQGGLRAAGLLAFDRSCRDLLVLLVEEEIAHRQQTRLGRVSRRARFPFLKTIDDFDYTYQRVVRLSLLGSALSPDSATEGRSLILSGKPGRGKTHLAIAIAYRAIQNGFDALFVTADQQSTNGLGPRPPRR